MSAFNYNYAIKFDLQKIVLIFKKMHLSTFKRQQLLMDSKDALSRATFANFPTFILHRVFNR